MRDPDERFGTQQDSRKFLSIKSACHRYDCGKTTIYSLIASGALVAKHLGRRKTLIDREVADRFFDNLPSKKK